MQRIMIVLAIDFDAGIGHGLALDKLRYGERNIVAPSRKNSQTHDCRETR